MTTPAKKGPVDLGKLRREAAVEFEGKVYPVKPLTGSDAQRVAATQSAETTEAESIEVMLDVTRRSVPSMEKEVFDVLSIDQLGAILAIARGGIDEVEQKIAEAEAARGN